MQENESMQMLASFDHSKKQQTENKCLSYNRDTNKVEQKNFLEQNKDNLKKK